MARDYCFTDFDTTNKLVFDEINVKYICYGTERCGTTDREHYQGFVCFNRTCRIPKAKSWLGGRAGTHLEPRRGTRQEARDYCRKSDGEWFEWGTFEQLTNKDIFRLPISKIKEEYPEFYCRYHRGLGQLAEKGPAWRNVEVHVIWGETGSGKTRRVMEMESVYKLDPPYTWFDGYEGEKIILLDDYEKNMLPRGKLLNLLDGYRLRLETKGGHCWALWEKVYITTNDNPDHWGCAALDRRISSYTKLVCDV